MSTTVKIAIAVVVALVIGVGGFFGWKYYSEHQAPAEAPVVQQPVQEVKNTFASTTMGIVVNYPMGYTPDPNYINESFGPKKPIHGVKFTIPQTMATGTNLSVDSGVSIEQLPRAKKCTGDIYMFQNVKAQQVVENGVTYSVASSSDAGAGNLYEEQVYALVGSSPCTAVRYFIHTTQIANYPEGTVRAYDRNALMGSFDEIRSSLTTGKTL